MRVGVICNLNAKRVRKGISKRIKAILKKLAVVVEETQTPQEVDRIISENINSVDVWCFVGGDGTLNLGLSTLWRKTGMKNEIKIPVLHGKAGSLNAISDKIPLKGDLDDIMLRAYDFLSSVKIASAIPRNNVRKFNTIKIRYDDSSRICFTFFMGTPYLISKRIIESRLATKRSILQAIYSTIAKFVIGQDSEKLIRQVKAEMKIDGQKYPYLKHYVIVGSVFREPALFFRPFVEPEKYKNGFYFFTYSGDAWTALRNFRLFATGRKRPPHSFSDIAEKVEIKAWGGVNFDGEIIDRENIELIAEPGPIVNLLKV